MPTVVEPRRFEGMSMSWTLNMFCGPKLTIWCGNCPHVFKKRIPVVDHPTIVCPACGAINRLNLVTECVTP